MPRVAHLTVLLTVVLACLLSGGCREGKLNLRRAENLSLTWLHNLDGFLNPPPAPPPKPKEVENAEGPDGAVDEDEAENEEDSEQPAPTKPQCLRDCFVDDGWSPEGFKNPTEAIGWLTATRRTLGKVESIDLVEDGAQITFELKGTPPAKLTALIVRENSIPKCKRLQQAQTAAEGTTAESKPAGAKAKGKAAGKTVEEAPAAPQKASKVGQAEKQAAKAAKS